MSDLICLKPVLQVIAKSGDRIKVESNILTIPPGYIWLERIDNEYNNEIEELELAINISITFLTLFATLISAWMKKQNYVEHISELSKYSLKIKSNCEIAFSNMCE